MNRKADDQIVSMPELKNGCWWRDPKERKEHCEDFTLSQAMVDVMIPMLQVRELMLSGA